jgi:hypothetical protein
VFLKNNRDSDIIVHLNPHLKSVAPVVNFDVVYNDFRSVNRAQVLNKRIKEERAHSTSDHNMIKSKNPKFTMELNS